MRIPRFRFLTLLPCLALLLASLANAADQPLKVFILAGQSNMQGHAHVRTIDSMRLDADTAKILERMRDEDGNDRICDQVWISSIGSSAEEKFGKLTVGYGAEARGPKIGPELTFGIYMQKFLDEPILLIKTAWGGKSLHTDFRSPSAGPYVFSESELAGIQKRGKDLDQVKAERGEATGRYYRMMMDHIDHVLADIPRVYPDYNADQGYELAGFVWFQGWNDMVDRNVYPTRDQPGGYDEYSKALAHFIRDVRNDLGVRDLPFVIGVMGAGGPTDKYTDGQRRYKPVHDNFRNAMAAPAKLPEFDGTVAAVRTEAFWDMRLKDLRARDEVIKQTVKSEKESQSLDRQAERELLDKLRMETFTSEEIELLNESVSNAEFHYLGSARIIAPIGRAFAEAMAEIIR